MVKLVGSFQKHSHSDGFAQDIAGINYNSVETETIQSFVFGSIDLFATIYLPIFAD